MLLIKASFMIVRQQQNDIAKYDIDFIHKILGQLDKEMINEACSELDQKKVFYSYLLANNR